jgi:ubiquinone biosynthesis monooxygenase Coq7
VQTKSSKLTADQQRWLIAELRSDHAGETGAVSIYNGILAVSRDSKVQAFALNHRDTEKRHLALVETILPISQRSLLLPLWRVAGFLTGAIPALIGANAVFATIAAVESFVDCHYQQQIERLAAESFEPQVRAILEKCREDELQHRDEALELQVHEAGALLRAWCAMVDAGSKIAVVFARLV